MNLEQIRVDVLHGMRVDEDMLLAILEYAQELEEEVERLEDDK